MSLADKSSAKSRSQNSSARTSGAASDLPAMVSESLNAPSAAASVTPYQMRSRSHSGIGANGSMTSEEKRRISEAGIANLQHLAVPEARRRLRVGLHAGREFHKARIISGRGEANAKPHRIVAKLIP